MSYYIYTIFFFSDDMVLDICKIHPELVLPHPFKCQQYYNCSMLEDRDLIDGFCHPVLHLTECIYPYMFSIDTLQCENFTDVKCGSRHEEKYYCKYCLTSSALLRLFVDVAIYFVYMVCRDLLNMNIKFFFTLTFLSNQFVYLQVAMKG